MTPDDLAALHACCFDTPRPWSAAEFADLLASPSVFLIATQNGFALGQSIAGEAELLTLAVAPGARRNGLGRQLLNRFEATAQQDGALDAFLEVSSENTAARALYSGAGYGLAGRRRSYYRAPDGHRIDALVLHKPLRSG